MSCASAIGKRIPCGSDDHVLRHCSQAYCSDERATAAQENVPAIGYCVRDDRFLISHGREAGLVYG
jgi:hypothetical protein